MLNWEWANLGFIFWHSASSWKQNKSFLFYSSGTVHRNRLWGYFKFFNCWFFKTNNFLVPFSTQHSAHSYPFPSSSLKTTRKICAAILLESSQEFKTLCWWKSLPQSHFPPETKLFHLLTNGLFRIFSENLIQIFHWTIVVDQGKMPLWSSDWLASL